MLPVRILKLLITFLKSHTMTIQKRDIYFRRHFSHNLTSRDRQSTDPANDWEVGMLVLTSNVRQS
jgi:hypothetical protein